MEEVVRAERLLTRGFISKKELQAVKDQLKEAEIALDEARTDLKNLVADPKESAHKQRELKK
jgi:multidrug resistance efflux pump